MTSFLQLSLRGWGLNICVQTILFSALRFDKASVTLSLVVLVINNRSAEFMLPAAPLHDSRPSFF